MLEILGILGALYLIFVSLAPDGDAVDFVREASSGGLIDAVVLCPGFSHEAVAEVAEAAGESIGVTVARGDG